MARIDFDKMMDMSLDEIVADGFGKATKPKAARSSPYEGGTCRVFVGNLPYSATWQAVKDHMRKAGNVVHCDILAQPGTACGSKGCAVVQFSTPVEASKAVELTDTNIGGRPIFVREDREEDKGKGKGKVGKGGKPGDWHCPSCGDLQFARNQECRKCNTPRPDEGDLEEFAPGKGGKGGKPGDWHCPSCGDLQFARNQECRKCKTPRPAAGDLEEIAPGISGGGKSVYVGNLSYSVTWQDLKDHMRGAGDVVRCDILEEPGTAMNSKGCAIVKYATAEQAEAAIQTLTDSTLNGRPIFVREDREAGLASSSVRQRSDRSVVTSGGKGGKGVGCRVFVGNLPYSASWQDLKDHMRAAGNVVRCEILGQPGTAMGSKGCGLVEFASARDAKRAIHELTDTMLRGRPIWIREDREA